MYIDPRFPWGFIMQVIVCNMMEANKHQLKSADRIEKEDMGYVVYLASGLSIFLQYTRT